MLGPTPRQRLLLRIALYGGAFFVALPAVFAFLLTKPPRAPVSPRPPDRYEEVRFLSDGLRLRAWLSRGKAELPAVLIVHGLGDTLESYQEHAQLFLDRGHTVLLPDLRGHGGSEGTFTTLGGHESGDVRAAMRYLESEGLAGAGFVLMGHSMGGVAVLLAAADRTDVRTVIAEAPFDTYRSTVIHHARLLYGLPSWFPLIPLTIFGAEWLAGFDAEEVDAVAAASRIRAPLLAIVDGEDRRMPEPVVRRIVDAHPGPHEIWIASGVGHVGAILHPEWSRVVHGFLEKHCTLSGPCDTPIRGSLSKHASIERNPNGSQDASFDFLHHPPGKFAPQGMLTQKLLGKCRDLLTFQHAVLRDTPLAAFQSHVGRSITENGARWNNENIAREPVANIHGNDQRGPPLPGTLPRDRDPVKATSKRSRIQFQVFPI